MCVRPQKFQILRHIEVSYYQRWGAVAEEAVMELPSGAVITHYGSGSLLFYQRLKILLAVMVASLHVRKYRRYLMKLSVIKKESKGRKNGRVEAVTEPELNEIFTAPQYRY
jgi:hypothetical protein